MARTRGSRWSGRSRPRRGRPPFRGSLSALETRRRESAQCGQSRAAVVDPRGATRGARSRDRRRGGDASHRPEVALARASRGPRDRRARGGESSGSRRRTVDRSRSRSSPGTTRRVARGSRVPRRPTRRRTRRSRAAVGGHGVGGLPLGLPGRRGSPRAHRQALPRPRLVAARLGPLHGSALRPRRRIPERHRRSERHRAGRAPVGRRHRDGGEHATVRAFRHGAPRADRRDHGRGGFTAGRTRAPRLLRRPPTQRGSRAVDRGDRGSSVAIASRDPVVVGRRRLRGAHRRESGGRVGRRHRSGVGGRRRGARWAIVAARGSDPRRRIRHRIRLPLGGMGDHRRRSATRPPVAGIPGRVGSHRGRRPARRIHRRVGRATTHRRRRPDSRRDARTGGDRLGLRRSERLSPRTPTQPSRRRRPDDGVDDRRSHRGPIPAHLGRRTRRRARLAAVRIRFGDRASVGGDRERNVVDRTRRSFGRRPDRRATESVARDTNHRRASVGIRSGRIRRGSPDRSHRGRDDRSRTVRGRSGLDHLGVRTVASRPPRSHPCRPRAEHLPHLHRSDPRRSGTPRVLVRVARSRRGPGRRRGARRTRRSRLSGLVGFPTTRGSGRMVTGRLRRRPRHIVDQCGRSRSAVDRRPGSDRPVRSAPGRWILADLLGRTLRLRHHRRRGDSGRRR